MLYLDQHEILWPLGSEQCPHVPRGDDQGELRDGGALAQELLVAILGWAEPVVVRLSSLQSSVYKHQKLLCRHAYGVVQCVLYTETYNTKLQRLLTGVSFHSALKSLSLMIYLLLPSFSIAFGIDNWEFVLRYSCFCLFKLLFAAYSLSDDKKMTTSKISPS